jgi:hypothetical protein
MRRIVVLALLAALVGASATFAAGGDPQKAITPADQARAKSMLLRAADFNAAFTARPAPSGGGDDFDCAPLDESDLTLTGEATSPSFTATAEYVRSTSYVYKSRSDSNASWTRGTSTAGVECLRAGLRGQLQGTGVRFVSFKKLSLPKRGQRSAAFRAIATQQGLRVYLDVVALQVERAQAAVIYVSALSPPPQGELRRLTGLAAKRAEKAMRGA